MHVTHLVLWAAVSGATGIAEYVPPFVPQDSLAELCTAVAAVLQPGPCRGMKPLLVAIANSLHFKVPCT